MEAACLPENAASRALLDRTGFRYEGMARSYLQINGQWEDHIRYAMTAEEWADRADELVKEWL